jgi:hypothetical protein
MPRVRNLRANTSLKNRYGEPLWGSITPRKKTPKRVTPRRFTRQAYTPMAIMPNNAQRPRPVVPIPPDPSYSFVSQSKWEKYRKTETKTGQRSKAHLFVKEAPKTSKKKLHVKRTKNI